MPRTMARESSTVLSLDPGFAWLGWSVIRVGADDALLEMGLLRTEKSSKKLRVLQADDNFRRTSDLARGLLAIIDKHNVRALCFEAFSPVRSASVAAQLGHVYGALAVITLVRDLPVLGISPQQVRKKLGVGSKDEIADEVWKRHKKNGKKAIVAFDKAFARNVANHNHAWDSIGIFEACKDTDLMRMLRR